jgi:hypothetical protein
MVMPIASPAFSALAAQSATGLPSPIAGAGDPFATASTGPADRQAARSPPRETNFGDVAFVPAGSLPAATSAGSGAAATAGTAAAAPVLAVLQGQEAVLQRRYRGPEQQGQSHTEKSVRLPDVQNRRTLPVSRAWPASGAKSRPQILLTNRNSYPQMLAEPEHLYCVDTT